MRPLSPTKEKKADCGINTKWPQLRQCHIVILLFSLSLLMSPALSADDTLWWVTTDGKIQKAPADGTGPISDVYTGIGIGWGIALNASNNTVYWTDQGSGSSVKSASMSGGGPIQTVMSGSTLGTNRAWYHLAVDPGILQNKATTHLYWGDNDQAVGSIDVLIQKDPLLSPITFSSATSERDSVRALDIDFVNKEIYYAARIVNSGPFVIRTYAPPLTGSFSSGAYQNILTNRQEVRDLFLSVDTNKMYWSEGGNFDGINNAGVGIFRSDLDGSNLERLLTTGGNEAIGIFVKSNYLYYSLRFGGGSINRLDLNTLDTQLLYVTPNVRGIDFEFALIPDPPPPPSTAIPEIPSALRGIFFSLLAALLLWLKRRL